MKEFLYKYKTSLIIALICVIGTTSYRIWSKSKNNIEPLKINFSVSGELKGAENLRIYLEAPSDRGLISVADTIISASGSFKLEGNIPSIGYYLLRVGENPQNVIPVTMVPGDELKINCYASNFGTEPNASGTKWSSSMNDYLRLMKQFQIEQANLKAKEGSVSNEELTIQFLKIKNKLEAVTQTKILNKPANPFNIVMTGSLFPSSSFDNWDINNLKILKVVAQAFEESYPKTTVAETFRRQVEDIENAYTQYFGYKNGTIQAPEISLNTPEGKIVKLSELLGKIVLIDFWASWCVPCRKENPTLVKLYNKYKNKGFTILSVSLDEDVNAWKNAILTDGLVWPNHVSDLLGWKSSMINLYSIEAIPLTILINKEGKIIGKDLRGAALEQKITEIIN
jgi:thiol-disulfide isomerase/thioredoxin